MSSSQLIRPIGILGGTFDPIHCGHLRLALEALEQCNLRQVRFIPNGAPPHRSPPLATPQQRLEMVRLALHDTPGLTLDEREIYRAGPCYTVHTLESLREELGVEQPLCLLLGSDAFLKLATWQHWMRLFELAHIVVIQRPGLPLGNAMLTVDVQLRDQYYARLAPAPLCMHEQPAGAIVVLDMPLLEISATDLRQRMADGRALRHLLPDSVNGYIHTHRLYTK